MFDTRERNISCHLSAVKSKSICLFKNKECNCHRNTATKEDFLIEKDCSFANVVNR
jgi:hypothetical protein